MQHRAVLRDDGIDEVQIARDTPEVGRRPVTRTTAMPRDLASAMAARAPGSMTSLTADVPS
jgi:hypothetical protein